MQLGPPAICVAPAFLLAVRVACRGASVKEVLGGVQYRPREGSRPRLAAAVEVREEEERLCVGLGIVREGPRGSEEEQLSSIISLAALHYHMNAHEREGLSYMWISERFDCEIEQDVVVLKCFRTHRSDK